MGAPVVPLYPATPSGSNAWDNTFSDYPQPQAQPSEAYPAPPLSITASTAEDALTKLTALVTATPTLTGTIVLHITV